MSEYSWKLVWIAEVLLACLAAAGALVIAGAGWRAFERDSSLGPTYVTTSIALILCAGVLAGAGLSLRKGLRWPQFLLAAVVVAVGVLVVVTRQ